MSKHRLIAAALLAATVAALVGVSTAGGARHATTISVMAVWTGAEQKSFEAVLAGFQKTNSGVKVKYTSGGDQMPTVLATKAHIRIGPMRRPAAASAERTVGSPPRIRSVAPATTAA